jgi:hypothetical protein
VFTIKVDVKFAGTAEEAKRLLGEWQAERQLYVWRAGASKSGVCPECAVFVGCVTTGDGTDGLPAAQAMPNVLMHDNCVCTLEPLPVVAGVDEEQAEALGLQHMQWLATLPKEELERVVGKRRAQWVVSGKLTVGDLYDVEGGRYRLLPLKIVRKRYDLK